MDIDLNNINTNNMNMDNINMNNMNNINMNNMNNINIMGMHVNMIQIFISVYMTICIIILAYKMGVDNKVMAYLPGINVVLLCEMAQVSQVWAALILIPNWIVQTLFMTFLWIRVLDSSVKPRWHAVFLIIPGINLIYITYLVITY